MPERLLTTMIGSYPQPDWLVDRAALGARLPPRVRAREIWRVDEEHLKAAQDDATLLAIRDLERAGLDVITDGEIRRESYSNRLAAALEGMDVENPGTAIDRTGHANPVPAARGPVRRRGPVLVDDVRFLRAHTDRQIKITLPGPFTMSQQAENVYYADQRAFALDLAAAVNEEVADLFAAGADVVQLDEPYLQARPQAAAEYALEAIDRALAGATGTTALHTCFGYAHIVHDRPAGYPFLAELNACAVDQLAIEGAQQRLDPAILAQVPDKQIVWGVLDLGDLEVESVETIAARIRAVLRHVPAHRLQLAPDCGMKYLPRDVAFAKLAAMVQAARLVEAELADAGASGAGGAAVGASSGRGAAPAQTDADGARRPPTFHLGRELQDGRFERQESRFRRWVRRGGELAPEAGRYHLYACAGCPWSHRTLIVRAVKGLEDAIGVSYVDPLRGPDGWAFTGDDYRDEVNGFALLREAYLRTDPGFEDRVSVPVLWDRETGSIVSNESADIIRMMNAEFTELARHPEVDLYPPPLRDEIDALNERIYRDVNNGVYRAGFAVTQEAYEEAFFPLFERLAELEQLLGRRRYLAGDVITEADWRLFVTLVRFDAVYYLHFRCNGRRVVDHPNLFGYARELYQQPGIADTVEFAQIMQVYKSHDALNPTRIIPAGPLDVDWWAPHGRG